MGTVEHNDRVNWSSTGSQYVPSHDWNAGDRWLVKNAWDMWHMGGVNTKVTWTIHAATCQTIPKGCAKVTKHCALSQSVCILITDHDIYTKLIISSIIYSCHSTTGRDVSCQDMMHHFISYISTVNASGDPHPSQLIPATRFADAECYPSNVTCGCTFTTMTRLLGSISYHQRTQLRYPTAGMGPSIYDPSAAPCPLPSYYTYRIQYTVYHLW